MITNSYMYVTHGSVINNRTGQELRKIKNTLIRVDAGNITKTPPFIDKSKPYTLSDTAVEVYTGRSIDEEFAKKIVAWLGSHKSIKRFVIHQNIITSLEGIAKALQSSFSIEQLSIRRPVYTSGEVATEFLAIIATIIATSKKLTRIELVDVGVPNESTTPTLIDAIEQRKSRIRLDIVMQTVCCGNEKSTCKELRQQARRFNTFISCNFHFRSSISTHRNPTLL